MIKYCALSVALPLMFETFKLSLVSHSLRTVVSRCAVARVSGVPWVMSKCAAGVSDSRAGISEFSP